MKNKYQVGERILALNKPISGKVEAFTIKQVKRSMLICESVECPIENVEYHVRKSDVLGHSDL